MFRSPHTLFDQHVVLNVEIEWQDLLNSIPLLLSCDDPAAGDLLSLIGECCFVKEVVIAIQKAVERLEVSFNSDDDGFEEVEQKSHQQAASSPVVCLSILTGIYAACESFSFLIQAKATDDTAIPKLKLRKKTVLDTLRPFLAELETVNVIVEFTVSTEEGRALISVTASLVKRADTWVKGIPDAKEEDALGCIVRIIERNLLLKDLSCIF